MASTIYKGKDLRLKADGKVIYHATECTFSSSMKIESIATKDTNGEVGVPSNLSWSMTSKGLIANKPAGSTTHQDVKSLLDLHKAGTEIELSFTTGEVGDIIITGNAFIESASLGAPVEGNTSFDASFKGNGDYTVEVVA
ncbi:hypothetical protein G4D82_12300 [Flavobacterium sp. CYK-4]|uniref:phage tail tube protein n=1 Tax=Flavobacterium lotistagni TaxID=2709660 RepID=UPI00140A84A7|nr:phage tail tube protein [Flavobacterium lotistagni]NHM08007.1 hypothetical protein [Flavobacterium lotistagni]